MQTRSRKILEMRHRGLYQLYLQLFETPYSFFIVFKANINVGGCRMSVAVQYTYPELYVDELSVYLNPL